MLEIADIALMLLVGFAGGFLSGLLGVGGGMIFIPVFDILFNQEGIENEELVRFILANSFLAIFFSGIISSYKHYKNNNFNFKVILSIAVPAAAVSAILSYIIRSFNWYNDIIFNWVFTIVIALTIAKHWRKRKTQGVEEPFSLRKYILIGLTTGVISTFSGLGGGMAMIPLLVFVMGYGMKNASATSIGVIPLLVLPMLFVYANGHPDTLLPGMVGYLQFATIIPIIFGIFLGVPVGIKTSKRMSEMYLHKTFISLLIVIIIKYLWQLIIPSNKI